MPRPQKRKKNQFRAVTEALEARQLLTTLSIADVTVQEDVGTFSVTATLSETEATAKTVSMGTGSGTAEGGADYVIEFKDVEIPAGQLTATAEFQVINDQAIEDDEHFFINAFLDSETAEARITVVDNDTPVLSVADLIVNENAGTVNAIATLSSVSNKDVTVNVFPVTGSGDIAQTGDDYQAGFQTATIPAGQLSANVPITIINDSFSEDTETFTLQILSVENADVANSIVKVSIADDDGNNVEFRSIDGSGNNHVVPDQGAAHTQVIRFGYEPGYPDANGNVARKGESNTFQNGNTIERKNAPNAREVSNKLMDQKTDLPNARNLSDWIVQWGQFLTHDMALVHNGSENNKQSDGTTANYSIDVSDPTDPLGPGSIPFNRSRFDPSTGTDEPRQQMNSVTSYIDASVVYGSDDARANALRTFSGGRLKTSAGNLPPLNTAGFPVDNASPLPDEQMFLVGDERGTEATGLVATQTLFLREHNRLAAIIDTQNPELNDEQIYQWARRIVSAEIQKITYEEFLPALMGESAAPDPNEFSYDPGLKATITNSFTTAFFRYGHSMQSSRLLLVDNNGTTVESLSLADIFNNPGLVRNNPTVVGQALKGLASQVAQENDVFLVDEIRNFLFGPAGAGGLDLGALDVQRGRDHGLLPMNELRTAYKLPALVSSSDPSVHPFAVISSDPFVQQTLASLYDTIDEVDAFVGGIAEDHVPGASIGPTLQNSFKDQFSRLRDGDRFFYTGDAALRKSIVTSAVDLESRTLADIIRDNSNISNLQDNVFFTELPELDFGDAPAPYPTSLPENGARHLPQGPRLGGLRSSDGSPAAADDGVSFVDLVTGGTGRANVELDEADFARVDAWIDFNADGDWSDPNERIANSVVVERGMNRFFFSIPSNTNSSRGTMARVRVSTDGGLSPTGFANDGEVEDYNVSFAGTGGPTAPDANPDFDIQAPNTGLTSISATTLLANDTATNGPISITSFDATSVLGARIASDGRGGLSYDPNDSEVLRSLPLGIQVSDIFQYTISDANGMTDSAFVTVNVFGTNTGEFPTFNVGSELGRGSQHDVDMADLDGDGDLDAFYTSQRASDQIWLNIGGSFVAGQALNQNGSIYARLGDVDNDGDVDIVVAAISEVAVWKNDGKAGFTKHAAHEISSAHDVALGDIDGDGDVDFFVARSGGQDQVWLNNGRGDYSDSGMRLYNGASKSVELGDFDNDGDLDAIIGADRANTVWRNDGNGHFTDSGQRLGSAKTEHVEIGDLDSDGDLDAMTANSGGSAPNVVYFNDGSGVFTASGQTFGESTTSHVTFADFDRDGDLDAMTANWFFEEDRVWSNLGNGFFVDSGVALEGVRSSRIAVGDIDGDDDLDAVFASFASDEPNRVWFNSPAVPVPTTPNYEITAGQDLALTAQASSDPLGRVLVFLWDLNNDGDFDNLVGETKTVAWSELAGLGLGVGTHDITLRASALGTTDFADTQARLTINQAPKAVATAPDLIASGVSTQRITVVYTASAGIDASDIGANNIEVELPNGSVRTATFESRSTNSDATTITAVYRLNSLGSFYSAPDSGTYTVRMRSNQVSDTNDGFVPAGAIGSFNVNITPQIDVEAPTATAAADDITRRGQSTQTITVTYADNTQIDANTIGDGDINVVLPNNSVVRPTFVSRRANSNGTWTATYRLRAPGSSYNSLDNGTYTINVRANQVRDLAGNDVPFSTIGSFRVGVDSTPPTAVASAPNITANQQRSQTITVTYNDNFRLDLSTFGNNNIEVKLPNGSRVRPTFLARTTNSQTNEVEATYRLSAPRGSYSSLDNGQYEIHMRANQVKDQSGQAVNAGKIGSFTIGVDSIAPSATATAPDISGRSVSRQTITVVYNDNVSVRAGDIGTGDIEVELPNGATQQPTLISRSSNANTRTITATYRLNAPGGFYNTLDNGRYTVRMRPNQVRDTTGLFSPAKEIGAFAINIPVEIKTQVDSLTVDALPTSGPNSNGATVNVIANDASPTNISLASVNGSTSRTVHGKFGTVTWTPLGQVTYLADGNKAVVQDLPLGETLSESFDYVATNGTSLAASKINVTVRGTWARATPLVQTDARYGGDEKSVESLMGDFDGDGDLDVFVSNQNGPDQIWVNDGDGNFTDSGQRLGNERSIYGELGDIDSDGDIDIMIAGQQGSKNLVWVNDGTGQFTDSGQVLGDPAFRSYDVALGDLNGNGHLDAIIVNQGAEFASDWVFFNDGNGNFTKTDGNFGWYDSTGVALGDLDNDGDLDAVIASQVSGANQFVLNDGNGNFTDSLPLVIQETQWKDVRFRNVRNNILGRVESNEDLSAEFKTHWDSENLYFLVDVHDDVLVTDMDDAFYEDDSVSIYIDGGNEKSTFYDSNDQNFTFRWNDDNIRHNESRNTPGVLKAERRTSTGYIMEMSIPWSVIGVEPAEGKTIGLDVHINDDDNGGVRDKKITWHGLIDRAFTNPSVLNAFSLPEPCEESCDFRLLLDGPYAANAEHVELGDIDGDGDIDLIDASAGPNRVWLNEGNARFVDSGQQVGNNLTSQVLLHDLDGDSDLDMVAANWTNHANTVWLNNGEGIFVDTGVRFDAEIATEHISFGDLDGDGDSDAYVSGWGFQNRVYMNTLRQPSDAPVVEQIPTTVGENQRIEIAFSHDVSADLDATKLSLTNVSSQQRINLRDSNVIWDAASRRASFSLQGIPQGEYLLVLGNVANTNGVLIDGDRDGQPGGDFTSELFVTWQGDTDLDGDVDFTDFLVVADSFGRDDIDWMGGDFNGDGLATFYDFLQVSNNFGKRF